MQGMHGEVLLSAPQPSGMQSLSAHLHTCKVLPTALITRMQRARTALLLMNCIAIVGYAAFPLMPPRLVPDCDTRFGGCDRNYTFVDTMDTLGGIWSWRGSALEGVSRLNIRFTVLVFCD